MYAIYKNGINKFGKRIGDVTLFVLNMAALKLTLISVLLICTCNSSLSKEYGIDLNEDNWHEMLDGQWMVEFYAPWCPACKGLTLIWSDFAQWAVNRAPTPLKVARIDVTNSPGLSGRFMVTALPTIFHVMNGEFRQYKGSRDLRSFSAFVSDDKWQAVDPVPSWKSPNSLQMSVVASFFKFSQLLRAVHNHFTEEFGLPTWGSYLIFAIGTILLGAMLGLVMVCVLDVVYPPKIAASTKKTSTKSSSTKGDKNSEDELADEDIRDDLYDDVPTSTDDGKQSNSGSTSPKVQKRKPRKAD